MRHRRRPSRIGGGRASAAQSATAAHRPRNRRRPRIGVGGRTRLAILTNARPVSAGRQVDHPGRPRPARIGQKAPHLADSPRLRACTARESHEWCGPVAVAAPSGRPAFSWRALVNIARSLPVRMRARGRVPHPPPCSAPGPTPRGALPHAQYRPPPRSARAESRPPPRSAPRPRRARSAPRLPALAACAVRCPAPRRHCPRRVPSLAPPRPPRARCPCRTRCSRLCSGTKPWMIPGVPSALVPVYTPPKVRRRPRAEHVVAS